MPRRRVKVRVRVPEDGQRSLRRRAGRFLRRAKPHLLILLAALVGLAVVWLTLGLLGGPPPPPP